jgi:ABC-type polysaccharide/polyol phosphate transport system ATPase subunit
VSFDIKQGQSVGFIGRNGAGKSTILKLLASVTKPTSGRVTIDGRVAALIEVGAGFHPELTGRENIFLNGSILGMKKAEINKCFDSIVSFAELEQFIETPVKHYSSGMYVRLGFAIAVHTNPDIFLIDEVLAVGDGAFQKKCLDTLASHRAKGKTMILVSHDLEKVRDACDRCIYVNGGGIRFDGLPRDAIKQYREDLFKREDQRVGDSAGVVARLVGVDLQDPTGAPKEDFHFGEDVIIQIRYHAEKRLDHPGFGLAIYAPNGDLLTCFNTRTSGVRLGAVDGQGSVFCRLRNLPLRKGTYRISVWFHDHEGNKTYDSLGYCCSFNLLSFENVEEGVDGWIRVERDWYGDIQCRKDSSVTEARNHTFV